MIKKEKRKERLGIEEIKNVLQGKLSTSANTINHVYCYT
jgi:hypothetical protein